MRLGKELLKEMYYFLHDEYMLDIFKELKCLQELFLKNLASNHIKILNKEKLEIHIMKDNGDDIRGIYNTLVSLNFNMETKEDLYFKTKAFLDIFRVFVTGYVYLED